MAYTDNRDRDHTEKGMDMWDTIYQMESEGWRQITEKQTLKEDVIHWRTHLTGRGQETRVVGNEKAGGYVLMARREEDRPTTTAEEEG